jgi:nitrite reductase/ring-hydroxylating ferredoxin subunit
MAGPPRPPRPDDRGSRFPFTAYPIGWYALGRVDEFPAGQVRTLHRFGRDLVVFRSQAGKVAVLDAICPHLGAHLGAGTVRGEELVCPFHGFGFDTDGRCSSLPAGYGSKIPARLACGSFPVRAVNGFLVIYFDPDGQSPTWEVPEQDLTGWRPIRTRRWKVRTHPQESGEGSVDLGHLRSVHQYLTAEPVTPLSHEGPSLRTHYRVTRRTTFGMAGDTFAIEFSPHLHGLGFSTVEVEVPALQLRYRIWILATPMDVEHIDYQVGIAMQSDLRPRAVHPAMALLPRALAVPLVEHITWKAFVADVELDFPIWENKGYVHPPALAAGDGPIGVFRRWATQFYRSDEAAAD